MKRLHRNDLYAWSVFDAERNIDFNSVAWVRGAGNVLIDPLPLSAHDLEHLASVGGASWIVVTNSDHVRDTALLAKHFGCKVAGPRGEREKFPIACDVWLGQGDLVVSGLRALELHGSKTPGELALLLDDEVLIVGDLVRAHRAGSLMTLPDPKLKDKGRAIESVRQLAAIDSVRSVLVGDGWSIFERGNAHLRALADSLRAA